MPTPKSYPEMFVALSDLCDSWGVGTTDVVRERAFANLGSLYVQKVGVEEAWRRLRNFVEGIAAPPTEG